MSKTPAESLLEKMCLATYGEEPENVMKVLVAMSRECCERWGVKVEDFAQAMRDAELKPREVAS